MRARRPYLVHQLQRDTQEPATQRTRIPEATPRPIFVCSCKKNLLGLSLRHGQESSPCLSGTNASLYTSDSFSVHTKTKHGNARCRGKSVYVPARRRRDRLATFTILGDGGVPMPEPELTSDYTPVTPPHSPRSKKMTVGTRKEEWGGAEVGTRRQERDKKTGGGRKGETEKWRGPLTHSLHPEHLAKTVVPGISSRHPLPCLANR